MQFQKLWITMNVNLVQQLLLLTLNPANLELGLET
jgi:hypothetical protein